MTNQKIKCRTCFTLKPEQMFAKRTNICKKCDSARCAEYRKTKEGVVTKIYSHQKLHSAVRNHPMPTYTRQELKDWLFSHKDFERIFNEWVESNHQHYKKPSVDRLDDYKPYSLDNIQLVTWGQNVEKAHHDIKNGINNKTNKRVFQYSLSGELIQEFHSRKHAGRKTGVASSSICSCVNGRLTHAGGFLWANSKIDPNT